MNHKSPSWFLQKSNLQWLTGFCAWILSITGLPLVFVDVSTARSRAKKRGRPNSAKDFPCASNFLCSSSSRLKGLMSSLLTNRCKVLDDVCCVFLYSGAPGYPPDTSRKNRQRSSAGDEKLSTASLIKTTPSSVEVISPKSAHAFKHVECWQSFTLRSTSYERADQCFSYSLG